MDISISSAALYGISIVLIVFAVAFLIGQKNSKPWVIELTKMGDNE